MRFSDGAEVGREWELVYHKQRLQVGQSADRRLVPGKYIAEICLSIPIQSYYTTFNVYICSILVEISCKNGMSQSD